MPAGSDAASAVDLELLIPATAVAVPIARGFIASVARAAGCDDDTIEDAKLAVSEALTSSIKSHARGGSDEPIRVVTTPADGGLWVTVIDSVAIIDLDPAATETFTPPAGLFEGTLGMTLVQSLFPDVEISSETGSGTTVRFLVRASNEPADLEI